MFTGKIRLVPVILLSLVMVFTLGVTSACTPAQAQQLEGILQNVDAVSGNITIITKDGKTITLTIAPDAPVEIQGASSNITTLERGASVKVEVDKDGKVTRSINARQAEVQGVIVQVAGNVVTVESERGQRVTVNIGDNTTIKLNNNASGTLNDLKAGTKVVAKYDPSTSVAFKVEVQVKETESSRGTSAVGWGIVEIHVTDPPPANVKSAIVHFSKIEVHKASGNDSDNASDNASGWISIIGVPSSFDLMSVIGVEQILGSANITAGSFTQIRMNVTEVTGVTTDNVSYTAEVPSGELKIAGSFNVGGGNKTVLTLDFDGEQSLIRTGQGKFLFKPVVKLLSNNSGKSDDRTAGVPDKGQNERKDNSGKKD